MSEDPIASRCFDPGIVLWRPGKVELGPPNVIFGVVLDPWMINGSVIRDEIEHQP